MDRGQYAEQPERIEYMQHRDGSAEARLRKNIHEETTEDGTIWVANEVYIPRTFLSQAELDANFDSYFLVEPETTIADLTEAIDILTSIVLGE